MKYILLMLVIISCSRGNFSSYLKTELILDSVNITTYISKTKEQHIKGLSHIRDADFSNKEAMLFYNVGKNKKFCRFWMPNTHFNLDIVFLDSDFRVVDIDRNLEKFPYSGPMHWIPISREVKCTHVLEIKSKSPFAKKINKGMLLKWKRML